MTLRTHFIEVVKIINYCLDFVRSFTIKNFSVNGIQSEGRFTNIPFILIHKQNIKKRTKGAESGTKAAPTADKTKEKAPG